MRSTTRLTPTTLNEGNQKNSSYNKSTILRGSNYRGMNPKDKGFAREHLRALSNQASKAWWVRRTHGGAATDVQEVGFFPFGSEFSNLGNRA